MIGEFIRDHRQSMVVATKYTCAMTNGDVNAGGNHRKNMVQSLYRRSAPTQPPRVCALVGDDPVRDTAVESTVPWLPLKSCSRRSGEKPSLMMWLLKARETARPSATW
jgi:aryl-alcohol dehydrogenase-like predicted oxidoreductase